MPVISARHRCAEDQWGNREFPRGPLREVKDVFAYLSLQLTDEQLLQRFPGLVAVADILESLRRILATNIEHHLLTTTVTSHRVS